MRLTPVLTYLTLPSQLFQFSMLLIWKHECSSEYQKNTHLLFKELSLLLPGFGSNFFLLSSAPQEFWWWQSVRYWSQEAGGLGLAGGLRGEWELRKGKESLSLEFNDLTVFYWVPLEIRHNFKFGGHIGIQRSRVFNSRGSSI